MCPQGRACIDIDDGGSLLTSLVSSTGSDEGRICGCRVGNDANNRGWVCSSCGCQVCLHCDAAGLQDRAALLTAMTTGCGRLLCGGSQFPVHPILRQTRSRLVRLTRMEHG